MERQLTRIDYVRQHLDRMLKSHKDPETSRNGYVHLYGVGQACALIALSRGHNRQYAELAEIAGMLHDYSKYYECIEEKHAEKSSIEARKILSAIGRFTDMEIETICHAILRHSDKNSVDNEFDEILIDADEMQHWLRNPTEDYFFDKERTRKIAEEFGLV